MRLESIWFELLKISAQGHLNRNHALEITVLHAQILSPVSPGGKQINKDVRIYISKQSSCIIIMKFTFLSLKSCLMPSHFDVPNKFTNFLNNKCIDTKSFKWSHEIIVQLTNEYFIILTVEWFITCFHSTAFFVFFYIFSLLREFNALVKCSDIRTWCNNVKIIAFKAIHMMILFITLIIFML